MLSEYQKSWKRQNKNKIAEQRRLYYVRHTNRELFTRRVNKKQAVDEQWPKWARTDEMVDSIQWFYDEARRLTEETGISHTVDHIESLRQSLACGLHVPWNLQVITNDANRRKG